MQCLSLFLSLFLPFFIINGYICIQTRQRIKINCFMAVTYQTYGVKSVPVKRRETTAWLRSVAARYGKKIGELAYIFCDDDKIMEVNKEYLNHDYYTDVITFDYTEGDVISGDVFISLDTVRTNAEKYGAAFDDELHRVIVHGVLHLCGINDKGPGERELMEKAENEALALLAAGSSK